MVLWFAIPITKVTALASQWLALQRHLRRRAKPQHRHRHHLHHSRAATSGDLARTSASLNGSVPGAVVTHRRQEMSMMLTTLFVEHLPELRPSLSGQGLKLVFTDRHIRTTHQLPLQHGLFTTPVCHLPLLCSTNSRIGHALVVGDAKGPLANTQLRSYRRNVHVS